MSFAASRMAARRVVTSPIKVLDSGSFSSFSSRCASQTWRRPFGGVWRANEPDVRQGFAQLGNGVWVLDFGSVAVEFRFVRR